MLIAVDLPTARINRCVPPPPGMTPSLTSGTPNLADSPATTMSQASASSQPPPKATPSTAAITGLGKVPRSAHRSPPPAVRGPNSDSSRVVLELGAAFVGLEVADDDPLAGVEVVVETGDDGAEQIAGRRLDLEDVGTEGGQACGGERAGQVGRQGDDADAV